MIINVKCERCKSEQIFEVNELTEYLQLVVKDTDTISDLKNNYDEVYSTLEFIDIYEIITIHHNAMVARSRKDERYKIFKVLALPNGENYYYR